MIKSMFFDLDGTLLNSKKEISTSTLSALERCKNLDIKLFLSTARPPSLTKALGWSNDVKNLFEGGVFCNGALTVVENTESYLFIPSDVIHQTVLAMKSFPNINLTLQMKGNIHAFNNELPKNEYILWGIENESILSTDNCSYCEVIKILIFDGSFAGTLKPLPSELFNILSKICGKRAKLYLTDGGRIIQIGNVNVSKYKGVKSICTSLGLCDNQIAVFGDDLNDIEVIKGCKHSVAMGNAVDEIKQAAEFITHNNDDDGIAFAVDYLLELD